MRNTLGLDDDLDPVKLREALEAAFGMRFSATEAAACGTVGDVFQVVRNRFPSPRSGAGGCATAMAFYRVRRALPKPDVPFRLAPSTQVDAVTGIHTRMWLKELGQRSGLRGPQWKATLVGQAGTLLMVVGLVWLLLTALVARHLWPTGAAASMLGFVLIRVDPGKLPADCQTLGGLARKVAGLNFGGLYAQGAKARDQDLWDALVEVLSEYTLLPKAEIYPGTLLL